jgi:hypothetical protein
MELQLTPTNCNEKQDLQQFRHFQPSSERQGSWPHNHKSCHQEDQQTEMLEYISDIKVKT